MYFYDTFINSTESAAGNGAESAHPIIGDVRIKYVSVYPDGKVTSWSSVEAKQSVASPSELAGVSNRLCRN